MLKCRLPCLPLSSGFFAYGLETAAGPPAGDEEGDGSADTGTWAHGPHTQSELLTQLQAWGFTVAEPHEACRGIEALLAFHARLEKMRADLAFDVDGVVYKLEGLEERGKVGRSARAPRWALAHKFSAQSVRRVRECLIRLPFRLTSVHIAPQAVRPHNFNLPVTPFPLPPLPDY